MLRLIAGASAAASESTGVMQWETTQKPWGQPRLSAI